MPVYTQKGGRTNQPEMDLVQTSKEPGMTILVLLIQAVTDMKMEWHI